VNLLDMRTLVFGYGITNIICVVIVALLWRQSRSRFQGIGLLVIDFIFQASALILIVLRGAIPDWMSMVFSNTLVVAGALLGEANRRPHGRKIAGHGSIVSVGGLA
jgi:hypothetical protein